MAMTLSIAPSAFPFVTAPPQLGILELEKDKPKRNKLRGQGRCEPTQRLDGMPSNSWKNWRPGSGAVFEPPPISGRFGEAVARSARKSS